MKNKQLVENILKHVGGTANIATAAHCMTRLRLNLKDTSLVDEAALNQVDGVMGVVNKGKQTQIVIGTDVANVYKDFIELTGLSEEAAVEENLDDVKSDLKKKKGNLLTGFFETIAGHLQSNRSRTGRRRLSPRHSDDRCRIRSGQLRQYLLCDQHNRQRNLYLPAVLVSGFRGKAVQDEPVRRADDLRSDDVGQLGRLNRGRYDDVLLPGNSVHGC